MKKILIFGNSGSGKSTLAKRLVTSLGLAHLDLDTVAWEPTATPKRSSIEESKTKIESFINSNEEWVIEGCYTDLLSIAIDISNEIIFLNLSIQECIINVRNRPWEPHKYESKAEQDTNLEMLADWIAQYNERNDDFSKTAHEKLYREYRGEKRMFIKNEKYTF